MKIIINALTAVTGGQKTVLNNFINYAIKDKKNSYIIFVNSKFHCEIELRSHVEIVPIDSKSLFTRLKWDLIGLKKWSKKNKIKVDFAISLQNTGFKIDGKKAVLLHNVIPFKKERWSIIKKNERKFWFLLNVYSVYQKLFISKNDILFVQTEYMKNLVQTRFKRNNIEIINTTKDINIINEKFENKEESNIYFYPADDYVYKNHKLIIDSIIYIKKCGFKPNIKIKFTLTENSWVYKYALENNTMDVVSFVGNITHEEVMEEYKKSTLLFCSEMESLGLPLEEATKFNTNIVILSQAYALELLRGYQYKKIIPYEKGNVEYNVKQLAKVFVDTEYKHLDFISYINNELKGEF